MTVESQQKRKMSREEAGRKGGLKVSREYGLEFFREIGKKGGEKVVEQHGSEFFREIGRKGGESRGNKSNKTKVFKGSRTKRP